MAFTEMVFGIVCVIAYVIVLIAILYFGSKPPTNPPFLSQKDIDNFIGWRYIVYEPIEKEKEQDE